MSKFITLAISIFFLITSATSQSKLVYERDSKWFWGLNVGSTWQTTDVKNQHNWGVGLTLGKSFNYNYGKRISFDIRGRYLYGNWYGLDADTTAIPASNITLNSNPTNYKDGLGYSVYNFKTEVHRLALELVIHANGIRERSGWDPYIFGGVGLTWYQTMGDLLDGMDSTTSTMYDYGKLNGNFSKANVNTLLDGNYESALDGTKKGSFNVGFMPSLGFGLGYQVAPRFSIGLEHKTTFTRIDNFDGVMSKVGKYPNDLYHYTSFYLRFQVKNRHNYVENDQNSLHNLNNYDSQTNASTTQPPLVIYTNPSVSGSTVNAANFTIRADVKNVDGRQNIAFIQNGNIQTNFLYDPTTDRFESAIVLVPGQNIFEITATNTAGKDSKSTVIIYNQPVVQNPPIVSFTNPPTSPYTVNNPSFSLLATVLNVTQANQVTVSLNGQAISNFNFNAFNLNVSAPLTLNLGTNIVTVTGTNSAGTDSETITLVYVPTNVVTPPATGNPPIVSFSNPPSNPYTVNTPSFNLVSSVLNVSQANQISVKLNGQSITNFNFNPTTHVVTAAVTLGNGANIITVTGTNNVGVDSENTTIYMNAIIPTVNEQLPIVNFINPAQSGSTVTLENFIIRADVKFVNGRENISFKHNGIYNGTFTYNTNTDRLECAVVLQPGQNVFEIIGTNMYGMDQETTIIVYNRPQTLAPPVVTYTNPASSPYTTINQTYTVYATVLNVQQANQINVKVNGVSTSNFTFNALTSSVSLNLNLTLGSNIVVITGTNTAGSDTESTTIIYKPGVIEQLPVVYFVDPQSSPYTTLNATFAIQGIVLNVAGSQNITFKQNGVINQNFTYNSTAHSLQSSVILTPGQNVFEIIGTNSAGTAQATSFIIYERQAPKPPIVTITNPSSNPFNTENATFMLNATVLNVTQASQIQVTMNGQILPNFTYVASTNAVSAFLNLNEGSNTITVQGTNNDGTDIKQTVIIYKKPIVQQPPVVTFTAPNVDPYTSSVETYTVTASVLNVANSSGINVNINGVNITNFTFTPATTTLTFPVNLIEGANVIVITGTNLVGSDSKTHTIIFKKPAVIVPPIVTFQDPMVNPLNVFNQSYDVKVRVQHVDGPQNIQLKINGIISTNFNYSNSSELMTFTTSLNTGSNILEVTGTNAAGQDVKSTTLIFKLPDPMLPPTVTITTPSVTPEIASVATAPIVATVLNVDSQNNIQVVVNGVPFTGFSFNAVTKQLTFTISLNEGVNTITISASNNAGQASDSQVITYRKPVVILPPFVTYLDPVSPGSTVSVASYAIKAKITNVDVASQVVVQQNGQTVNPSNYTFNTTTKEILFNTSLNPGNNTFTVTGTNAAGSHSATTNIIYRVPIVICEKPVITVTNPSAQSTEIETNSYTLSAQITNITSANQVQLNVNGVSQSLNATFNLGTKVYTQSLSLSEGQNTVELIVTNSCGVSRTSRLILYKPAKAPCLAPIIQKITPSNDAISTQEATSVIKASIINLANANGIILKLNGNPIAGNYDLGTKELTANVNLAIGLNTIEIQASNECGSTNAVWKITRRNCIKPEINITTASTPDNGATYSAAFTLNAIVSGMSQNATLIVTQNGQQINYVYNPQTMALDLDRSLVMGSNAFVITATNDCGTNTKTYTVKREADPKAVPPTIQITNPPSTPYNSAQGAMNIQVSTHYVTAANQVSITVNGVPTNFNFNPTTGAINFNQTLVNGNNVIVATATNQYGYASDTKTVVFTIQRPKAPQIFITSPESCPAFVVPGMMTITGYITNITSLNQAAFYIENTPINAVNPIFNDGNLYFTISVNIIEGGGNKTFSVNASNSGGSDSKSCYINVAVGRGANPNPPKPDPKLIKTNNTTKPTTPTTPAPSTPAPSPKPVLVPPSGGRGGR